MKDEFYKKFVREAYQDEGVIKEYSTMGLWPMENILINKFLPKSGKILDIGCGAGRTSIPLAQLGYDVSAVDLSLNMIKAARIQAEEYGVDVDFQEMNAKELLFEDRSFDYALFSANGFDHVPGYSEKIKVFREVHRVLKPGSLFIFSVHRIWCPYHLRNMLSSGLMTTYRNLISADNRGMVWGDFDDNLGYMSFMVPKKWEKALNETGFEIVSRNTRFQMQFKYSWKYIIKAFDGNFIYFVVRKPETQ